ncbi:MAG: DUF4910 domain-containing protein [Firmicutes bacterium]|nr:DUF4910 domain-containing protein [Bacillota bacterium]
MFKPVMTEVAQEFSGIRAYDNVKEITGFHRIQVTPGFREAAARVAEILSRSPLDVTVLSYPADGRSAYWGYVLPEEWVPREAELWIVEPEGERRRLASFQEMPISLVQRSAATPPEGLPAELVVLERGEEEETYQQVDVAGKLVLARGDVSRLWRLAVKKYGALGLITDQMNEFPPIRERVDLPDALQYTSFWWYGEEKRAFGFVLSPREGDGLRQRAKELQQKGVSLKLWARVEAAFQSGHMENVTAFLPGQTAEEVLVVGHLCHPKPGANDNASGAGTVMEVARTLASLVTGGRLPRPRRGIRFLLVPEMAGTYAYLATNEERIPQMVAGINLDMVGEKQELCGSSLLVEKPALALPSFAGDLAALILRELTREAKNFSGSFSYALFRHSVTPFSGGSDHYVLSDPTVGVPTPMIIQWPDRFYHTSQDTIDKVDPEMLRRVGILTATYAYFLAQAGYGEALYLGQEMVASFASELHQFLRPELEKTLEISTGKGSGTDALAAPQRMARRINFLLERKIADLESLQRLVATEERPAFREDLLLLTADVRQATEREKGRIMRLKERLEKPGGQAAPEIGAGLTVKPGTGEEDKAAPGWQVEAGLVPRRLFRGPVNLRPYLNRLEEKELELWLNFEKDRPVGRRLAVYAVYWADGKRTLAEIADLVELETGWWDPEYLIRYFRLLARLGLVEISEPSDPGI